MDDTSRQLRQIKWILVGLLVCALAFTAQYAPDGAMLLLGIAVLVALVFIGWSILQPIFNAICDVFVDRTGMRRR